MCYSHPFLSNQHILSNALGRSPENQPQINRNAHFVSTPPLSSFSPQTLYSSHFHALSPASPKRTFRFFPPIHSSELLFRPSVGDFCLLRGYSRFPREMCNCCRDARSRASARRLRHGIACRLSERGIALTVVLSSRKAHRIEQCRSVRPEPCRETAPYLRHNPRR